MAKPRIFSKPAVGVKSSCCKDTDTVFRLKTDDVYNSRLQLSQRDKLGREELLDTWNLAPSEIKTLFYLLSENYEPGV